MKSQTKLGKNVHCTFVCVWGGGEGGGGRQSLGGRDVGKVEVDFERNVYEQCLKHYAY